jgi:hypothetical protein
MEMILSVPASRRDPPFETYMCPRCDAVTILDVKLTPTNKAD